MDGVLAQAMGLALAKKYPISTVLMLDKYPAPCANAYLNVDKLGVTERALVATDFGPWPFEKADVITINPHTWLRTMRI